jgi:hypothetical protein
MSMNLWYGPGDDDAVSVGGTIPALRAFAEVARVLGDDPAFGELQSVPGFAEQEVSEWWLGQVREQARAFLRSHAGAVSADCSARLAHLAAEIDHVLGRLPRG